MLAPSVRADARPNSADYATFNSFFYRALRPGARPVDRPGDTSIISSSADCRLTVYPTVDKAKEFWIKVRLPSADKEPAS